MPQKAATIETLPDDLREQVEEDVRAGDFADADQAIRQAILSQHERLALRRSVFAAEAACERGEGIPGKQVFDEIRDLSRKGVRSLFVVLAAPAYGVGASQRCQSTRAAGTA